MNQTEVLFVPISGEQASTSQLEAGHQVADWSTLCKFCCCCCFTFSLSHVSHSVSFVVFVLFPFSVSHQPSACSDSISIWVCIATHQTKLRIRQIDTLAEKWSIQLYIRVAVCVCVFLSVCLSVCVTCEAVSGVFKNTKYHDTCSLFMYIRMLVLVHWLLLILINSSVSSFLFSFSSTGVRLLSCRWCCMTDMFMPCRGSSAIIRRDLYPFQFHDKQKCVSLYVYLAVCMSP